jgi:hypothetical protein
MLEQRYGADDFNDIPSSDTKAAPRHSWMPVDLYDWRDNPPPKPTLAGIGYPGMRHLVSGEPDSCKTWLVLCLALEEIRHDRSVIYIDFENGPAIILDRLRSLPVDEETIQAQFLYLHPHEPIGTKGVLGDVEMMLAVARPSMCVLDSSAGALALHDCEPNSAKDVERFAQAVLDPLRSLGAATFLIDHVTKDRDTRGRFATGSERKLGVTDVHLGLETLVPFSRGRSGKVKIVNHKDRIGWLPPRQKIAEFDLTSDEETGVIAFTLELKTGDDETGDGGFRPTKLMERVSRALENYPGAMSKTQLREMVKGRDEYVLMAVDALHVDGYISIENGDRGARLITLERPYREEPQPVDNPVDNDLFPPVPDPFPERFNVAKQDEFPF